ncbi:MULTISPECIES: hypothetical protein [Chryseobacterium]|uniref:Uncharacterized protein n=1 Tax=Chryseobacterium indologenes TaxID=253 RepID=A0AAD1DX57_CHRID|nr:MULTISPECIES: hypothetical protein [Chryseobacterium]ASE63279.1 hypothetical protein CEQ15_18185 [Chryseobacterium indologenes]ATN07186.1 hypothetical protein CRN76_18125 [Chryseobacterium indologenes]AYY84065.1 hypothetical protein EGX91_05655 [Chryseobacterium indologenes]AZB18987.1 hypothetical protein EG352_14960 [Chryseobacterium indologenes]QIX81015.1 hypothetical protein FOB56_07105 [Chryseobacterium indologenes]
MQNIQDLKEKIFFESMNIIDNLDKINNVDELLSKQDLVDELANRISFLKLLEKNIEYFITDDHLHTHENNPVSSVSGDPEHHHDHHHEVTEEEAIFNNELNEIDEHENDHFVNETDEEEAVFNNQLNEIVENEFHENIVSFVEENSTENVQKQSSPNEITEEEAVFNSQLNEIENEPVETNEVVFSFVEEEKILAEAQPDSDEDINEDMFNDEVTEEEVIFNNQLNEIDDDEISDHEIKQDGNDPIVHNGKENGVTERIPSIFDTEMLEDEILIEEDEDQFMVSNSSMEQGELGTETSNVENVLNEIKNDHSTEDQKEESILAEVYDRRKIVEIDKPVPEETEKHPSDESFENLEAYQQEKKIKLSNIKGLKAVQSLFDDDPLEREIPKETQEPVAKEETGSILKSNIPTHLMEADKQKPEFKLDLNDRIAFSKMLFEGSQTDLNDTVAQLNHFKTLEEAKEYLSDLYYERKWSKVDEYAQRLWILVENKFL